MVIKKNIPIKYLFSKVRTEFYLIIIYVIGFEVVDLSVDLAFLAIPISLPTTLGTAISIILAFRVNQAYARWWEARKVWGEIVNESRTLVRQLLTLVRRDSKGRLHPLIKDMAYRQIAWTYSLGQSLRGQDPLGSLEAFLSAEELAALQSQKNVPNALLLTQASSLALLYRTKHLTDYQLVQIDQTHSKLCNSMGKCERIKNTVFPAQYSLIIEILLGLFIFLLPLGMLSISMHFVLPIILAITLLFFLIENTSELLQDPFENRPTDTPVTAIARTIEINIRQMLAEQEIPEKQAVVEEYYLM